MKIEIASPCNRRWDQMTGDERVRFCASCQLHVYNVASLSDDEMRALFAKTEGRVCGRVFKRADGTVITRDCPVGVARLRRRIGLVITTVAALIVAVIGTALNGLRAKSSDGPTSLPTRIAHVKTRLRNVEPIKTLIGPEVVPLPEPVMGKMIYIPPKTPTPAPEPTP